VWRLVGVLDVFEVSVLLRLLLLSMSWVRLCSSFIVLYMFSFCLFVFAFSLTYTCTILSVAKRTTIQHHRWKWNSFKKRVVQNGTKWNGTFEYGLSTWVCQSHSRVTEDENQTIKDQNSQCGWKYRKHTALKQASGTMWSTPYKGQDKGRVLWQKESYYTSSDVMKMIVKKKQNENIYIKL
jgi:hypothetical protein